MGRRWNRVKEKMGRRWNRVKEIQAIEPKWDSKEAEGGLRKIEGVMRSTNVRRYKQ
jgi:hypothetical protein